MSNMFESSQWFIIFVSLVLFGKIQWKNFTFSILECTFFANIHSNHINNLIDNFEEISSRLKISFSLAASAFNFPSDVVPELQGFSWDKSADPNYELIKILEREVSLSNRYTNSSFDLNRPGSEQLHLARFLVSERSFMESVETLLGDLESISNDLVETVTQESSVLSSVLDTFYLQTLIFIISIFALIQLITCVFLRSNDSQTVSHVQQKIDLLLIRKFQKQTIIALVLVSVALCLFFVFTIFGASYLSAFPQQIQLAGLRAALVDRCTSVYLNAYSEHELRDQSFHFLTDLLDQLESVHSNLLYKTPSRLVDSSAGRHNSMKIRTIQPLVVFLGLIFFCFQFVQGMRAVINDELDADFRSSIFPLVEIAYTLTELGLDSLDIYHAEISEIISSQRFFSVILLIVFVIVVISVYFLVFRPILRTLTAEEEISLHLLSMIPSSVIDDSPHIRHFVSQFG
ncbi:hypothetical protein GEMRC1_007244 [Eukaryota sp. GEM-RC1]